MGLWEHIWKVWNIKDIISQSWSGTRVECLTFQERHRIFWKIQWKTRESSRVAVCRNRLTVGNSKIDVSGRSENILELLGADWRNVWHIDETVSLRKCRKSTFRELVEYSRTFSTRRRNSQVRYHCRNLLAMWTLKIDVWRRPSQSYQIFYKTTNRVPKRVIPKFVFFINNLFL